MSRSPFDGTPGEPLRALILGCGPVGRATGAALARRGHQVAYRDVVAAAMADLPADNGDARDLVYVCVGTAAAAAGFDLSAVRAALAVAAAVPVPGGVHGVVVVRSTLTPGACESFLQAGLAGRRGLCYQPAFCREGRALAEEDAPAAIVAAVDGPATACLMASVFARFPCPVHWTGFAGAETAKLWANLLNALKITAFNTAAAWAEAHGDDPAVTAAALAAASLAVREPAYGTRPGTPFAGRCLPKDLEAAGAFAAATGLPGAELLAAMKVLNARTAAVAPVATDG
ncbi:MAG: hypothetical protein IT304_02255 [Dehalococcoidia bacterium]|nr:hypothetical protein [Dehalococcoidia bacterium]